MKKNDSSSNSALAQPASMLDANLAQQQLLKVNRALKLLSDGNEVLIRAKSEQQLLRDICRLIVESGGYLMAWVGMAERDEAQSVRPVAQYGDMAGYLEQVRITWADTEQGRGPSGLAIRTGKAQVNQSFLTNPAMAPWREAAKKSGYQSSISLPLKEKDSAFGALTIYSVEPHAFNADEAKLLADLSGNLAYGILSLREHAHRTLVEQELRESEERFRVLVEYAPEAIVVFDVEQDLLVDANANAEKLFECSYAELMRRSPRDFYPPAQPDASQVEQSFRDHNERALQGEQPVFERLLRSAKGKEKLCEVRLVRLPFGGRKLIRGSMIDITERKNQEQKLRESTAAHASLVQVTRQLKSILDNLFAYVALLDTDGIVQEVNLAPLERAGLRREQVIGGPFQDAPWWSYDEKVRARLTEAIAAARQGQTRRYDEVVKMGDELITIDFQISPIRDDEGRVVGLLPTAVDIAERKRAEEELKLSAQLLNSATDSIFLIDLDGNFVYLNDAAWMSRGYTRDEMMAMNLRELNTPEFAQLIGPRIRELLEKGHGLYETAHYCKDGSILPVEISSRVIEYGGRKLILASIRDITERKKTEAVLKQHKQMIETSIDGFWVSDMQGNLLEANEAYAKISGYSVDELAHMHISRLEAIEQSPEQVQAHIATVIRQGYDRFETRHRHKDGHEIDIEVAVTYMADTQRLIVFCKDITRRKQGESAIKEAILELERKELAKTRFLAAAGHDLRQPLAAANLYLDSLRRTHPTQDQDEIIVRMDQSMDTFKALLDALLNISRLDSGAVKPEYSSINVPELIVWLEENFAHMAAEKGLEFRLCFPVKETFFVRSDMGLINSVLINLVSNAIKFTHQGGIMVSARRRGEHVLLQVWDTGIGIPDEYINLIFDEFYQINNPQRDRTSGLGLGLAITERALALLGERIECRSRVGHGSVFGFRLPLDHAASGLILMDTHTALRAQGAADFVAQGKRYVLVEDDILVAEALRKALVMMGGEVECFHDAEQAILQADRESTDYYIVDFMLGGKLNGIQFLNQLRQKLGKPVRAVLVTGDTSAIFARGANDCHWPVLHKPANVSQLLACLAEQET